MKSVVWNSATQDIEKFVKDRIGIDGYHFGNHTDIGLEEDGELIAGVVYSEFNGRNIFASIAAIPGRRWMTRKFLGVMFRYPFMQCKVDRVTLWIESSNMDSQRFAEHLGFEKEATLKGAARDGEDILIYVMFKEDCRFMGDQYVR